MQCQDSRGCTNEARYINELGILRCGVCDALKLTRSIRISDLGRLLTVARALASSKEIVSIEQFELRMELNELIMKRGAIWPK